MTRIVFTTLALFALTCLPSGCATTGTPSDTSLIDNIPEDQRLVDAEPGSVRYGDLAYGFQRRDTSGPLFETERSIVTIKFCDERCIERMNFGTQPVFIAGGHKPAKPAAPTAVAEKK